MGIKGKMAVVTLGFGIGFGLRAAGQHEKIDFKDKVVVITGGSRGLGLVIARQLAREGARLALLARDEAELESAKAELAGLKAEVLTLDCDVREQKQIEDAINQTLTHFGRIDILINNAGIIQAGPLENIQLKDFEDAVATHLWGPLYSIQATVPHMRLQGGGRIVNIASIGGKIAVPHLLPYSASKHALVGLSDGIRSELAKDKIYVTTVSPGLLRTGSPPNALFKGRNEEEYTWFAVSDSSPFLSIGVERAAQQIIEACRVGQAELTITWQARLATIANILFPNTTATLLALTNRLLPKPTNSAEGDLNKTGWESQSFFAPSPLTSLSDQATIKNNELKSH